MYRVSPFTYLVSAMLTTGVANVDVKCTDIELLHLDPPPNQTCSEYLGPYVKLANAELLNPAATSDCSLCPISTTDQFLKQLSMEFDNRYRNVGLLFVYVVFNIFAALFLYWLIRMPKKLPRKAKKE
jgi:ATP-binding cassette subfamily G (WHITE) protein 2 (PDR)